jgi:hypothetical protein
MNKIVEQRFPLVFVQLVFLRFPLLNFLCRLNARCLDDHIGVQPSARAVQLQEMEVLTGIAPEAIGSWVAPDVAAVATLTAQLDVVAMTPAVPASEGVAGAILPN